MIAGGSNRNKRTAPATPEELLDACRCGRVDLALSMMKDGVKLSNPYSMYLNWVSQCNDIIIKKEILSELSKAGFFIPGQPFDDGRMRTFLKLFNLITKDIHNPNRFLLITTIYNQEMKPQERLVYKFFKDTNLYIQYIKPIIGCFEAQGKYEEALAELDAVLNIVRNQNHPCSFELLLIKAKFLRTMASLPANEPIAVRLLLNAKAALVERKELHPNVSNHHPLEDELNRILLQTFIGRLGVYLKNVEAAAATKNVDGERQCLTIATEQALKTLNYCSPLNDEYVEIIAHLIKMTHRRYALDRGQGITGNLHQYLSLFDLIISNLKLCESTNQIYFLIAKVNMYRVALLYGVMKLEGKLSVEDYQTLINENVQAFECFAKVITQGVSSDEMLRDTATIMMNMVTCYDGLKSLSPSPEYVSERVKCLNRAVQLYGAIIGKKEEDVLALAKAKSMQTILPEPITPPAPKVPRLFYRAPQDADPNNFFPLARATTARIIRERKECSIDILEDTFNFFKAGIDLSTETAFYKFCAFIIKMAKAFENFDNNNNQQLKKAAQDLYSRLFHMPVDIEEEKKAKFVLQLKIFLTLFAEPEKQLLQFNKNKALPDIALGCFNDLASTLPTVLGKDEVQTRLKRMGGILLQLIRFANTECYTEKAIFNKKFAMILLISQIGNYTMELEMHPYTAARLMEPKFLLFCKDFSNQFQTESYDVILDPEKITKLSARIKDHAEGLTNFAYLLLTQTNTLVQSVPEKSASESSTNLSSGSLTSTASVEGSEIEATPSIDGLVNNISSLRIK